MEATCSSEMWVDFQWTTRNYIPEDRTIRILKSVWGYGLDLSGLVWGSVVDACDPIGSRVSDVWLYFEQLRMTSAGEGVASLKILFYFVPKYNFPQITWFMFRCNVRTRRKSQYLWRGYDCAPWTVRMCVCVCPWCLAGMFHVVRWATLLLATRSHSSSPMDKIHFPSFTPAVTVQDRNIASEWWDGFVSAIFQLFYYALFCSEPNQNDET
jgi:hypothetical protein